MKIPEHIQKQMEDKSFSLAKYCYQYADQSELKDSSVYSVHLDGAEYGYSLVASELEALQKENQTLKAQNAAYKTSNEAQRKITKHAQKVAHEKSAAAATTDSEREMNAILTSELEKKDKIIQELTEGLQRIALNTPEWSPSKEEYDCQTLAKELLLKQT